MDDALLKRLRCFHTDYFPKYRQQYEKLVQDGQHPTTLFIGCSDSRLPAGAAHRSVGLSHCGAMRALDERNPETTNLSRRLELARGVALPVTVSEEALGRTEQRWCCNSNA